MAEKNVDSNMACAAACTGAGIIRDGGLPLVRAAFIASLPVLMGYVTMGFAFGVLLVNRVDGANALWVLLMSSTTVSGSMQFAAVEMLRNYAGYSLALTALLALLINIRYSVYGLPFIRIFRAYPWWLRYFLILGLTDESYAIICDNRRRGKARMHYITLVVGLDYLYWIIGGVLGALAGNHLPFPTDGIDFAMVALFVVILVDLCRVRTNRTPAAIGGGITAAVLAVVLMISPSNANKILLPAMAAIVAVLLAMRPRRRTVDQPEAIAGK